MALRLGDIAPDFTAQTTQGTIKFHEWIGNSWAVLFSHPKDFTPVCTTELGETARLKPEFDKRNVKIIGLSVDPGRLAQEVGGRHQGDAGPRAQLPASSPTPIARSSDLYDMIHPNANDTLTVRSVFVIDPDKKVRLILTYPASTGRNFDEILRVHRLAAAHRQAQRRDAGELEAGRRRDHRPVALRRRREEEVPRRLEDR